MFSLCRRHSVSACKIRGHGDPFPVEKQTDTTENITFRKLRMGTVIMEPSRYKNPHVCVVFLNIFASHIVNDGAHVKEWVYISQLAVVLFPIDSL